MRTLRQLAKALRLVWHSCPFWTATQLVVLVGQAGLPIAQLYLVKLLIDVVVLSARAPAGSPANGSLAWILGGLGGSILLGVILRSVGVLVQHMQAFRVGTRMTELIQRKSVEAELEFYENPEYRDSLHRALQEAPHRPTLIVQSVASVLQSGLSLLALASLVAVTTRWWILALIAAIAGPGILLRVRQSRKAYRWQRERTSRERLLEYYHWLLTSSACAKEIRLFGLGDLLISRATALRQSLHEEKFRFLRAHSLSEGGIQGLAALVIIGAFGWLAFQASAGAFTVGMLVMQYQAFQRGLGALHEFITGMSNLYENQLFMQRLDEFLAFQPQREEASERRSLPDAITRGIRFENVSFAYPGSARKVLDGVSFHIAPGEMVALVGDNGMGKSTIVKLLCRLYDPTAGRITMDGVDLRHLSRAEVRAQISVMFQDYNQFFLSAAENIWFGRPELGADDARIRQAATMAGADEVVEQLPRGYDQVLGRAFAGGEELSGGQWQKIALARAFFRDSPIVVLDEPSSALDVKSEHEIFQRFRELTRGKTSVVISHRFSTVRMADRILLFHGGKVAEAGSHEELIADEGLYAGLFETQAGMYR